MVSLSGVASYCDAEIGAPSIRIDFSVSSSPSSTSGAFVCDAVAPFDGQFGDDQRVFRRQPKGKSRLRDEVIAWAIVLEPEDLAGI